MNWQSPQFAGSAGRGRFAFFMTTRPNASPASARMMHTITNTRTPRAMRSRYQEDR